jgi:hypothetical protein
MDTARNPFVIKPLSNLILRSIFKKKSEKIRTCRYGIDEPTIDFSALDLPEASRSPVAGSVAARPRLVQSQEPSLSTSAKTSVFEH